MSRRRRNEKQEGSATSPSASSPSIPPNFLQRKTPVPNTEDHIASVTQLWTLPRATLLLITPVLASTTLQVAPQFLEPLYGNVFSSLYFHEAALASILFGISLGFWLVPRLQPQENDKQKDTYLSTLIMNGLDWGGILLALGPLSVKLLFTQSGLLGPKYGPHFTQLWLAYPILFLLGLINTIVCARRLKERNVKLLRWVVYVVMHWVVIVSLTNVLYKVVAIGRTCQRLYTAGLLLALIGGLFKALFRIYGEITLLEDSIQRRRKTETKPKNVKNTTPGMSYVSMIPQIIIVLLALYNANFNPQCNSSRLEEVNAADKESNYIILARNESVTGWIDIVEESTRDIRVMRAGHSLIGGVYRNTWDSVFGSFYFMEAVRLVEGRTRSGQERALQIGLGIGVSVSSLQASQVYVDIVEIDPVVYAYAVDYFRLVPLSKPHIQDGRRFINEASSNQYDYVLHDVFTGGSVPSTLFSIEALIEIRRILKNDGVLALNYVGTQKWPHAESLALVYNTIKAVFPYINCYREGSSESLDAFENMVFFASTKPIRFRPVTSNDTFESGVRQYMLENFEKWPVDLTRLSNVTGLITDHENPLNKLQRLDAFEHWHIMRELFPLEFWLNY
ncbi:hypothetical protein G9A89_004703 [Geosiphon pyriformis]|nr:hypothetical protein G9A89_004703 [Geosiphon pyriformis]